MLQPFWQLASLPRVFVAGVGRWGWGIDRGEFAFTLTPGIVASALIFSLVMGFVGGFLPAIKASRMKFVNALRAD